MVCSQTRPNSYLPSTEVALIHSSPKSTIISSCFPLYNRLRLCDREKHISQPLLRFQVHIHLECQHPVPVVNIEVTEKHCYCKDVKTRRQTVSLAFLLFIRGCTISGY
jgi:hypothetical protein